MLNKIRLLLVEDNDDHAEIITYILQQAQVVDTIDRAKDGEEALTYLSRLSTFNEATRPDIILLDVKLPRLDGLAVLARIKQDESLKTIPVVMLTTSNSTIDREVAYRNFANSYLVKPGKFEAFREMLGDFGKYWGEWNMAFEATR